jgi:hypothetical protein
MAKRGTITAWLRKKISHLDYGTKWNGQVIHCNKNEEVIDHLRNKTRLSHVNNKMLENHFSGLSTLYFAGNSWGDETMGMLDIDCHHGIGSLAGAMAYAQWLKDNFLPDLYYEPSTNGKGVHGYFVLVKGRLHPSEVNRLFGLLQAFLRQTIGGFDIETVEIKGRCPVIIWGNMRGEVANYKAGTLAKIPRQKERFEELMATTRLTVADLLGIMSKPVPHQEVKVVEEEQPSIKLFAEELSKVKVANRTKQTSSIKSPAATVPKIKVAEVSKIKESKVKAIGSSSDHVISAEELQKLGGHYLSVAKTLLGTHPMIRTGRVVATAEDLAIFLLLLKWFSTHMNDDGSLPWARFKGLWDALFEVKDVSRAFDPKRFAALRNYLSSLGLLDWSDEKYHRGFWYHCEKVAGQACKWKAGEMLMKMLNGEYVDNQRDEETSLAGAPSLTWLQQTIQSLTMVPFSETIRPIWIVPEPYRMPTTKELEEILGWAA